MTAIDGQPRRETVARHRAFLSAPLLALLVASAAGNAGAQALKEVVEAALATHPRVLAADAQRRAAAQDLAQARGGYFPTLDVNLGGGRERTSSPDTRATGADTVRLNRRESGVLLSQNLFAGNATMSEVERQNARLQAAGSRLAETREDIALKAVEVYLEVLKNRELVRLSNENLKDHLVVRDKVRLRVQGGVAQKADLQQALGRVALASSAVTARAGRLREAEANYVTVVGKAPGNLTDPKPSATQTVSAGGLDRARLQEAIRKATDTAITSNPSLGAANAEVAAAEAAVRGAKSPYFPRLDLELASNRNENIGGIPGNVDSDSVMLVLRWNLFRGGSDLAQERAFSERRYAAIDGMANTRRDVEERVAVALNAKATSEERLAYLREHASLSAEVLEAYKQQLDLGRRSLLDVLNAENELFTARSNLVTGRYEDLFNQYAVEAAKGLLVESLGIKPAE
ncbi:MAG: TolC family outer membrane protein [Burkholderiales bacterium]|nr:TolC family outer membrane protein [Burkholderiales bacterium]